MQAWLNTHNSGMDPCPPKRSPNNPGTAKGNSDARLYASVAKHSQQGDGPIPPKRSPNNPGTAKGNSDASSSGAKSPCWAKAICLQVDVFVLMDFCGGTMWVQGLNSADHLR
ncbi:hypothetical protein CDAR_601271 [Caerostris darwini]|uniref:Uncharacterized protein n=1 Tax=Caerostris darwini TaxID=1538125 RepID=A0AAV4WWZ2_9ARAC|nr:hypothetical protein CDAR_601271 [Caerostris darwini]